MSGRMVVTRVMVILVFGILPARVRAEAVIWSTGFESGLTGEWTAGSDKFSVIDSSLAFEGDKYLNVVGPSTTGGDSLLLAVSSAGYQSLSLTGYSRIYAGLEANDRLSIEWSVDGLNWQTLVVWSNLPVSGWTPFSLDLPEEADGNSQLTLRWLAEFDGTSDRGLFDQLALSGQPIPEPMSLPLLIFGSLIALVRRYFW